MPGVVDTEAPDRFRIVLEGAPAHPATRVDLRVVDGSTGALTDEVRWVPLHRISENTLATNWFVLTGSMEDRASWRLDGQVLFARLGDVFEVRYRLGGARSRTLTMPVGGGLDGRLEERILEQPVTVVVLRNPSGGAPLVGGDDMGAAAVVRYQIAVANEVLSQCHITLGDPRDVPIRLVDPPGGTMLSVGDDLPVFSRGAVLGIAVNGVRIGPIALGSDYTPEETSRLLARAIRDAGYTASLAVNPSRPDQSLGTADILVSTKTGQPVEISLDGFPGMESLGILAVGRVVPLNGIDAYGPSDQPTGTLEERTLLRALSDGNAETFDIFVVDGLTDARKQGESFTSSVQGELGQSAIIDWKAFANTRQAYVLAHELGHLLQDSLEHPDQQGDARPWLLMNSNAVSALGGPRLITETQCRRMREGVLRGNVP